MDTVGTLDAPSGRHPTSAPSHDDLLRSAHHVWAVAHDGGAGLVEALTRLRDDLGHHARAEAGQIDRLPGATPGVARGGQQRLVDVVERMLGVAADEVGDGLLAARAAELVRLLERQIRMETALQFRLGRR